MESITVTLSPYLYQRLQEKAVQAGTVIEKFTSTLVAVALQKEVEPGDDMREAVRLTLQATGRGASLSDALRAKIMSDVTLEEVQAAFSRAGGRLLSTLIQEQRETCC